MPRLPLPLLLCALTVSTACTSDDLAGPDVGAAALAVTPAPVARPAGGRCATTVVITGFSNGAPTSLEIDGTCHLRHLGRTTMHASQTLTATGGILNTTTYTAANGDVLRTQFEGQASAPGPNVTFIGTETYTGGTGRFAGATGSSALEGSASVGPDGRGTGEYTTNGTISY